MYQEGAYRVGKKAFAWQINTSARVAAICLQEHIPIINKSFLPGFGWLMIHDEDNGRVLCLLIDRPEGSFDGLQLNCHDVH